MATHMPNKRKLIRAATIGTSLGTFLNGSFEALMDKFELVLLSSPDEELAELHKRYGIKTIGVNMERRIAPLLDLRALLNMIKVFRRERPYMVHSMTPKAGLLCMMAAWATRVPRRVHTFTGLVWPTAHGFARRLLMLTDWITCACATHVIPEGKGVMADLQQHITRKPMRVLGHGNVRGVDMDFWSRENVSSRKLAQISDSSRFTFLFVGRIVRDKGINELIEAFMEVRKRSRVRLILVGPFEDAIDPVDDDTKRLIGSCGDIVAAGPQYGTDLPAYYAASDCFVFPSYREGFPNTVLEAGAMGLPSIVTNINGSREIIADGVNGLIIPAKDSAALAEAMQRMTDDADMRQRMQAKARPMIASRFEQGYVRQCMLDFYDDIS